MLTKQETLLGKAPGWRAGGQGIPGGLLCQWLAVSGFMVMGLVSRLSLANHSDSESFLVVPALFSQDGCQREGFWEVVGHVVSPFDLSRTFPVGGGLLVLCSLAGSLVIKQLKQMVAVVPGQGGGSSQCAPPDRTTQTGMCAPARFSLGWLGNGLECAPPYLPEQ